MQSILKKFAGYIVIGMVIAGGAAALHVLLRVDSNCDPLCDASKKLFQAQEKFRIVYLMEIGKCTQEAQCSTGIDPNIAGRQGPEAPGLLHQYKQSVASCKEICSSAFCPDRDKDENCLPVQPKPRSDCLSQVPGAACSPEEEFQWCYRKCDWPSKATSE